MKKSPLQRFLEKNSITPAAPLPLVHTSDSYLIRKAVSSGALQCSPCDIFKGENLLYFFVGRAAYKKTLREDPQYWELPSCLIFNFDINGARRIHPFDTGAFARKRYPNYITMMEISDYEFPPSDTLVRNAIGAFFVTNKNYYHLRNLEREKFENLHGLGITDEEIMALHTLIKERGSRADDRRFSIEVQYNVDFKFKERKLILAIIPEIYLESRKYTSMIRSFGARIETYPIYPLRKDYHYYAIYEKLDSFYRNRGYYEV